MLQLDDGPLMHMVRLARDVGPPAREQELRDFLGQFRFTGEMVNQAVGTLSGGEKARLVLAMLVWQRPNLLLLDEPTNHLDLTTREALSMALNEFEGTVMLVSHDRALLREVCDEFWLVSRRRRAALRRRPGRLPALAARGVARHGEGAAGAGLAARGRGRAPRVRLHRRRAQPAPQAGAAPASRDERKADKQARAKRSDATRPLRVELQQIDARLARLARRRPRSRPRWRHRKAPADFAELGRRLAHVSAEMQVLEERWLELQESLEALGD